MIVNVSLSNRVLEDNATDQEEKLSHALTQALGVSVSLAIVEDAGVSFTRLSAGETKAMQQFTTANRRLCWTRGRLAVKRLRARFGLDCDTADSQFPHKSYSITHCDNLSLAICCVEGKVSNQRILGVGIDFEFARQLDPNSARIFLSVRESSSATPDLLLRLWTAKEAIFKSDPLNDGCFLTDYEIRNCDEYSGFATPLKNDRHRIQYCSIEWNGGFISAAVARHNLPDG